MKKVLFIVLLCIFTIQLSAQQRVPSEKKMSIAAGVLQGGGGLVGVDWELLLADHLSAQVGAGLFSFGGGNSYHFKPYINSSMISVLFWHQGFGEKYMQTVVGPVFTYRAPKVFQCQIGVGYRLFGGVNLPQEYWNVPVMLMYSIGVYFPLY